MKPTKNSNFKQRSTLDNNTSPEVPFPGSVIAFLFNVTILERLSVKSLTNGLFNDMIAAYYAAHRRFIESTNIAPSETWYVPITTMIKNLSNGSLYKGTNIECRVYSLLYLNPEAISAHGFSADDKYEKVTDYFQSLYESTYEENTKTKHTDLNQALEKVRASFYLRRLIKHMRYIISAGLPDFKRKPIRKKQLMEVDGEITTLNLLKEVNGGWDLVFGNGNKVRIQGGVRQNTLNADNVTYQYDGYTVNDDLTVSLENGEAMDDNTFVEFSNYGRTRLLKTENGIKATVTLPSVGWTLSEVQQYLEDNSLQKQSRNKPAIRLLLNKSGEIFVVQSALHIQYDYPIEHMTEEQAFNLAVEYAVIRSRLIGSLHIAYYSGAENERRKLRCTRLSYTNADGKQNIALDDLEDGADIEEVLRVVMSNVTPSNNSNNPPAVSEHVKVILKDETAVSVFTS